MPCLIAPDSICCDLNCLPYLPLNNGRVGPLEGGDITDCGGQVLAELDWITCAFSLCRCHTYSLLAGWSCVPWSPECRNGTLGSSHRLYRLPITTVVHH